MYSNKKNILQLAALLKAHKVKNIILCPGSRNAPIVHTITSQPYFHCYSVTDERSAGFFAIGQALLTKLPTAICCTSGTALLNLHPAVAEAFYQKIPLIIISADRPEAWIGQMDGQTLPQPSVFHLLVKKSVDIPEICTEEDEWYCNRLINEALLSAIHHGYGPVHINIQISEPLFQYTSKKLPKVRVIKYFQGIQDSDSYHWKEILRKYNKRMLIIGQDNGFSAFQMHIPTDIYNQFCCFSENLGNTINDTINNFDTALYKMTDAEKNNMSPDILITFGGHIISKRLKMFIRQHPPKEHWHISPTGEIVDLYMSLTAVIEMLPSDFIDKISHITDIPDSTYPNEWKKYCQSLTKPHFEYSEMEAIELLIKQLPSLSILHIANSSAIRYAQLFQINHSVTVYCNRGTNGIEGSLSTAIGYAADSDKLNFVIIGDLSFFYDMNALWNDNYKNNLRIMLINNRGGEIFQSIPGLNMNEKSERYITATHQTSAKGWSEEKGFRYLSVNNETQLRESMNFFIQPRDLPQSILMEVFTDRDIDISILKDYYHQLKQK